MKIFKVTYTHTNKVCYCASNSKTLTKLQNRQVLYSKYVDRINKIRDALLPRFISEYEEGQGYWYYGFKATSKSGGSLEMCKELDTLDKYLKSKFTTWNFIKDINSVTIEEVGILED